MKFQSYRPIGLTAFIAASLFLGAAGCGSPGGHGPDGGMGGAAGEAGRGGNSSAGGFRDGGLAGGGGAAGGNGVGGGNGGGAGIGGITGSAGVGGAAGSAGIGGAAGSAGIGGAAGSAGIGGAAGNVADGGTAGAGGTAGRGADAGAAGSGGTRDAASDTPLDDSHHTDGGEDSGASNDADVDGDAAAGTCPGTGASGALPPSFNCSTNGGNCGLCLQAIEGGETVCATCSTAQLKSNCQALLTCLGRVFFVCVKGGTCYCSATDPTCSAGADGTCVAPIQALAGTTDTAEILRQIQDPSTIVGSVIKEAERFGGTAACDQYCGCSY